MRADRIAWGLVLIAGSALAAPPAATPAPAAPAASSAVAAAKVPATAAPSVAARAADAVEPELLEFLAEFSDVEGFDDPFELESVVNAAAARALDEQVKARQAAEEKHDERK